MLAAILLSASDLPPVWYGPQTVTFNVQVTGNPYDPAQNDLRVRFMPEKGAAEERIAYVDYDGTIKATLVSHTSGRFRAVLVRNGKDMLEPPAEGLIELQTKLTNGFIRVDSEHKNRFTWESGEPYYPVGFNLGWQNGDLIPMADEISKMASNGVNWTRIWSTNWDNRNPWWPNDDKEARPDELWQRALVNWDDLVKACTLNNVPFQFVLFNHGSFSSKVNPNWPDHPWNAAKGGFLKDAADFFTDPEARRRTKMWLRYAVARYGHSPDLFAWELFNEVEWVDARYADRWKDIAAWHKEMADYLRSIDPYKHLITTSSAMDQTELWANLDYYQPHTYPPSVLMAVAGLKQPTDKPVFFGEFGPPEGSEAQQAAGVRDGIYAAMLTNQAGAAQYWFWDNVEKRNMYPLFKIAAAVRDVSQIGRHATARPLAISVSTAGTATLAFGPGLGWGKTATTTLQLPADLTPEKLGSLSGYLQSLTGSNKDLFPEPLTFRFNAKMPGMFRVKIDQISKGGGALDVVVNGKSAAAKTWPAPSSEGNVSEVLEAPFSAGTNEIRLENRGADWVRINGFEFTNLGAQATGMALGSSDWLMLRLVGSVDGAVATVQGLSLADGDYDLKVINLETGTETSEVRTVKDFGITDYPIPGKDVMLIFTRRS
jgi:hypothetical protein